MNTKRLNSFIFTAASVSLYTYALWLFSSINLTATIYITSLLFIRGVAKGLYNYELLKEDEKFIEEFERSLNIKEEPNEK